jgi:hypothetical protein
VATEAAWLHGNNLKKEEKEKSTYKEKQNQTKPCLTLTVLAQPETEKRCFPLVKFRRFGAGIFKA